MENIKTTIPSNNTTLACSYVSDQDEILTVGILGYNTTSKTFEKLAGYRPNKVAKLLTHGEYLHDRVTLNNITKLSKQAFILFNDVRCIDATLYKCTISYLDKVLKLLTIESAEVNITITGKDFFI